MFTDGLDYELLAASVYAFLATPVVSGAFIVTVVASLGAFVWRTFLRLGRVIG